jgi:hypothetical protein
MGLAGDLRLRRSKVLAVLLTLHRETALEVGLIG